MTKKYLITVVLTIVALNISAQNFEKKLLYDQYTLGDTYKSLNTERKFQWDKIAVRLKSLDSIQVNDVKWAVLQNYKNANGAAPLVEYPHKDDYDYVVDWFGSRRDQATPLYLTIDLTYPHRYARDGALVRKIAKDSTLTQVRSIYWGGDWFVPNKYVKEISIKQFTKVICIDVTNQNIATLEKVDSAWVVRSMNPATTGKHKPPHMFETPEGIYVIQAKTPKMYYHKDGTTKIEGFAPYASRFSGGAYIHGIPVVAPSEKLIEYSWSLGTVPRSHMCVRNATSHAKFIYDWAPIYEAIVFVFE